MTTFDFAIKDITKVHDGDTCTVILDQGFGISFEIGVRMFGIDTPELQGVSKDAATIARDALAKWLNDRVGKKTLRLASKGWDKYGGRCLGQIYVASSSDEAAAYMVTNGFAKLYKGDKKTPWTTAELKAITDKK